MTPTYEARVEKIARAVAAVKCGLTSDPYGAQLPDDIWKQGISYALRIIAVDPLTLEYEHLLVERKNMLNEADEHAQLKADVVEVLTAARIDVDYKRSHSQNKIGMMNAVRTINMIDALLDRINGGVK